MLPSLNQLKLPDPWQHQAVNLLRTGTDVVVSAPTGAGKTYIFELLHQGRHLQGQAIYTVPTRALANDKYAEWKEAKWNVGIATGDIAENVDAPVVVATLETQLERLVRGEGPALLVIDEYQMISDHARGANYEAAVALAPAETRLLLLSGSVANPEDVVAWMRSLNRKAEVVATRERPVPLEEAPVETLPQRQRQFENYWPRFAAAVMLADLAPLLIFAPRRKEAESIARRLAADLPMGDPLDLTPEQRAVCGKDLATLIEKRIAFHHSGLSYGARAGVIEPLAKAGQLRVIVATMGLAAGINFSVRSVHVAGTTFHDGRSEHKLAPDELLQMYGRAGRRGLDDKGHVITSRDSPSIFDARPARLHRSALLAWPIFLRVMKHAATTQENPFEAAKHFSERLFAKVPPLLGLEELEPSITHPQLEHAKALFGLEATEKQVLNSFGEWERKHKHALQRMPLSRVHGTLAVPAFAAKFAHGIGRVGKIRREKEVTYGVEISLGTPEGDLIKPTKSIRRLLKLSRKIETVPLEEITVLHAGELAKAILANIEEVIQDVAPEFIGTIAKENLVFACFDLAPVEVMAYEDGHGALLFAPQERSIVVKNETGVHTPETTTTDREPRIGSPIHAWRTLGLIDAHGVPTRRGEIFSFFQHGEGLAVVAALEDESYPADDLVHHMANLRSGSKFDLPLDCGSERLAAVCRGTYGFVNHHGYLENGLPVDYGEGAAELLDAMLHPEQPGAQDLKADIAEGDISRAYVEWLSLLRHITHAPDHPWKRWMALKEAAKAVLKHHTKTLRHFFHLDLPPLTNKQKHGKTRHYLMVK
ncbi:MAG: DEAD/DEAH box helicase [Prosthecobacter sp.]|uniref:DEAD/DEAH box helicase n=1 Tax=Prosthecobacter sp. TaxID=1965333 RepID=UPI0019FF465B|nr:DEAD/DEAH box helicase [Prosthecobacter sp.]MBE2287004.1 DEAD/DEAH box helicase [Prosthecobacter sp.]